MKFDELCCIVVNDQKSTAYQNFIKFSVVYDYPAVHKTLVWNCGMILTMPVERKIRSKINIFTFALEMKILGQRTTKFVVNIAVFFFHSPSNFLCHATL